jgi:hypothetical protein
MTLFPYTTLFRSDMILLADLGFCALVFSKHVDLGVQTEVWLTDLYARVLAQKELEGRCTAAKVAVNQDQSAFLVMAQETNIVYVMAMWDLTTVAAGPASGNVCDIAFSPDDLSLFLILGDKEVHIAKFGIDV